MSTPVTLQKPIKEGLSENDLRIATAFIYTRFRGIFASIKKAHLRPNQTILTVWAAKSNDVPLFSIFRSGGRYVVVDEANGTTLQGARLDELLLKVRDLYPPSSPL